MSEPGDQLWAWFIDDEDSFIAELVGDTWYPLVFASEDRAKRFGDLARRVAAERGRMAVLRRYRRVTDEEGGK